MLTTKRIKILVRKNLKMSAEKIASQCVHAALGLHLAEPLHYLQTVIVLQVSDKKFEDYKTELKNFFLFADAGYTEVGSGTETCLAFLEDDPRFLEDTYRKN